MIRLPRREIVYKNCRDSFSHGHHDHDIYEHAGISREIAIPILLLFGFLIFFAAEKIASRYLSDNLHNHSDDKSKKHDDNDDSVVESKEEEKVRQSGKGLLWRLQNTLRAAGGLNLLADSMHNFTDGIAIGKLYR